MKSRQNRVPNRSRGSRLSACNELLFQPWFLPKRITYKIHGLMPPQYWKKMRYYFEDWGCIVCGFEGLYHSNGMCVRCYVKTSRRLSQSIRRHCKSAGPNQRLDLELFRQEKLAKNLLADFRNSNAPRGRRMIDPSRTCNPVYETFLRHHEPAVV